MMSGKIAYSSWLFPIKCAAIVYIAVFFAIPSIFTASHSENEVDHVLIEWLGEVDSSAEYCSDDLDEMHHVSLISDNADKTASVILNCTFCSFVDYDPDVLIQPPRKA